MDAAINSPEDDAARNKYCDAITECLKEKKISDEVLGSVILGSAVDRAANFLTIWRQFKKRLEVLFTVPGKTGRWW